MAAETGHAANRVYIGQDGALYLNGAALYDSNGTNSAAALSGSALEAADATITPAAGAANVCLVSIQVKDRNGAALAQVTTLEIWLSDAATGAGETATAASGAVAAGASGTDLLTLTTKKRLRVKTTAAGLYILSITDTVKTGFFPVVQLPNGKLVVGAQLVTGNYG